jgi:hypothetical protein
VIPIVRRLAMLAGAAMGALGLLGLSNAGAIQQEACVTVHVEAQGSTLVDQTVCVPPSV